MSTIDRKQYPRLQTQKGGKGAKYFEVAFASVIRLKAGHKRMLLLKETQQKKHLPIQPPIQLNDIPTIQQEKSTELDLAKPIRYDVSLRLCALRLFRSQLHHQEAADQIGIWIEPVHPVPPEYGDGIVGNEDTGEVNEEGAKDDWVEEIGEEGAWGNCRYGLTDCRVEEFED